MTCHSLGMCEHYTLLSRQWSPCLSSYHTRQKQISRWQGWPSVAWPGSSEFRRRPAVWLLGAEVGGAEAHWSHQGPAGSCVGGAWAVGRQVLLSSAPLLLLGSWAGPCHLRASSGDTGEEDYVMKSGLAADRQEAASEPGWRGLWTCGPGHAWASPPALVPFMVEPCGPRAVAGAGPWGSGFPSAQAGRPLATAVALCLLVPLLALAQLLFIRLRALGPLGCVPGGVSPRVRGHGQPAARH